MEFLSTKMLRSPRQRLNCSLAYRILQSEVSRRVSCRLKLQKKYEVLDSKLQTKMIEFRARIESAAASTTFRSMNSMILRFPKFRTGFRDIRTLFKHFDEDSDEAIGREDVSKCFKSLDVKLKEDQVDDLFRACDMDRSRSIQFNEFIVLLCLAYILTVDPSANRDLGVKDKMSLERPKLDAIFGTVVEAFLFLDKNGDGKLHKKDLAKALDDAFPCESSPKHITRNRFREMGLRRNRVIGFREFLFVFIDWVGADTDDVTET